MPRRLRCQLLCEDREQESLFRPILERMFGRVHVEPRKPKQEGGINFVFQSYADVVRKTVRRSPQESVGLVVVVDGDNEGLMQRLRELDQRLEDAGGAKRSKNEKIATCVPCRNVETWELWLCGRRDLNEADDYKADLQAKKRKDSMISRKAADAWFDQLSEEAKRAESDRLPSLAAGRADLYRLYSLAGKD
jgi:hypothetical protein